MVGAARDAFERYAAICFLGSVDEQPSLGTANLDLVAGLRADRFIRTSPAGLDDGPTAPTWNIVNELVLSSETLGSATVEIR
jgi:hypothetical protein